MMKLSAALIAICLAACAPHTERAASAPPTDCNKSFTRYVAFTAPDAQDAVETRALGDDCNAAVVLITVRKATGEPIWAWATPHGWPADPSASGTANPPGAMGEFLKNWANVRIDTTAALPDWPQRENVFKNELGAFMHTPFDRDRYLDIRSKAFPRLCYATGVESGLCIYYDAASGAVFEVLTTGA